MRLYDIENQDYFKEGFTRYIHSLDYIYLFIYIHNFNRIECCSLSEYFMSRIIAFHHHRQSKVRFFVGFGDDDELLLLDIKYSESEQHYS